MHDLIELPKSLVDIRVGDCLELLRGIPGDSIDCCVTSPPYFNLRNYGIDGQIGLEVDPECYIERLVQVFREVKRTLKADGTLWLNLGDSYAANGGSHSGRSDNQRGVGTKRTHAAGSGDQGPRTPPRGAKPKDLLMIPARVALALQADGWWLRSDIIWHKPNPVPESVSDRPTSAHEHVFLLTKHPSYFYDADAIREPHASAYSQDAISKAGAAGGSRPSGNNFNKQARHENGEATPSTRAERAALLHPLGRNRRNVWTIGTKPFKGAHFATMPPELAEICVLAGTSSEGHCPSCSRRWHNGPQCDCPMQQPMPDVVLDPFGGAGTTGYVAQKLGRRSVLLELNPEYAEIARQRCA